MNKITVSLKDSFPYGSCNGCKDHSEKVWVIVLFSHEIRLCDKCKEEFKNEWNRKMGDS